MEIMAHLILPFLMFFMFQIGLSSFHYPHAKNQPNILFVVSSHKMEPSHLACLNSLAGILAQDQPRIYQSLESDPMKDDYWLQDLSTRYPFIHVNTTFLKQDIFTLLQYFAFQLLIPKQYILYDWNHLENRNLALSFSGIFNSIIFDTKMASIYAKKLNFSKILDIRTASPESMFIKYSDSFSSNIALLQNPTKYGYLNSYGVFAKSFIWFSDKTDLSDRLSKLVLDHLPYSAILGWGTDEFDSVKAISKYGSWIHAADFNTNLELFTNLPHSIFPINNKQFDDNVISNRHTAAFLFTDGDNIQWIQNTFLTDPKWYGSPDRGVAPIGWTLSPALIELAPNFVSRIYDSATFKDRFVAAPSGMGYNFPSVLSDEKLNSFAADTASFMKLANLNILNIIDHYPSNFSKILSSSKKFLSSDSISAVLAYLYEDYAGLKGNIYFVGDKKKPVIGARYRLWDGFETPESLANSLLKESTDITTADGYSLIAVHCWSRTVNDVLDTIKLTAGEINFVDIDTFVNLISTNVHKDKTNSL